MSKNPREANVRASSHVARRNLPSPFSPHRIRGCSILFSLYTISGDFFPWDRPFPWGILNQPPPLQAFRAPGLPQYHIYCGTSRIHLFFHPHNTPFLYKKRFPCFLYRKADICFDYPFHIKPHIPCILVKLVLRTEEIHGVSARARPVRNLFQAEGERV